MGSSTRRWRHQGATPDRAGDPVVFPAPSSGILGASSSKYFNAGRNNISNNLSGQQYTQWLRLWTRSQAPAL